MKIVWVDFIAYVVPPGFHSGNRRGSASKERITNQLAGFAEHFNKLLNQFRWLLRGVVSLILTVSNKTLLLEYDPFHGLFECGVNQFTISERVLKSNISLLVPKYPAVGRWE